MSAGARSKSSGPAPPSYSVIEIGTIRFLITHRPTDTSLGAYIEELKKHRANTVVRVCEPTYGTDLLQQNGITVIDLTFDDGTFPPQEVIDRWFDLLLGQLRSGHSVSVAVHCVAGLGRAPVLVALALMELGTKYEDAVELIREKRHGAINAKQLGYLKKYKSSSRLKVNGNKSSCCLQ